MFKPSRPIPSSEITPPELFLNRRKFIKIAALAGVGAALAACGVPPAVTTRRASQRPRKTPREIPRLMPRLPPRLPPRPLPHPVRRSL